MRQYKIIFRLGSLRYILFSLRNAVFLCATPCNAADSYRYAELHEEALRPTEISPDK
jgi:hypothetical protein